MSAGAVAGVIRGWSIQRVVPRAEPWSVPDYRRILQLSLAAAWLFDAVLQLQPFMFTPAFGTQMVAPFAPGNPVVVADAITWSAQEMGRHSTLAGVAFAGVQLLIAVGIAWRPTVKAALGLSILWSFGVWWIGEGFGGLLRGTASPLNGAPGAVVLYALLAVLLWPSRRTGERHENFAAARTVGALPARLLWLVLWGGLAGLALSPANRAPAAIRRMIDSMAAGQPQWLAALDHGTGRLVGDHGLAVSVALAALLAAVAVGIFAPPRLVRVVLVIAGVLAGVVWTVGEGFGGVFSGPATDPSSGPLLIVLAAAYWPLRLPARAGGDEAAAAGVEVPVGAGVASSSGLA